MNVFRAALIITLVALFCAAQAVSAPDKDPDAKYYMPQRTRYANSDYKFKFVIEKYWNRYNKAGMDAKLENADFRKYGASRALGYTHKDVEEGRALFFADVEKNPRAVIGRFDRLRYLGAVFGPFDEIETRYLKISSRQIKGTEGAVYASYIEGELLAPVNKDESGYFTPEDTMNDSTGTTYIIRQRTYFIELPDDRALMLTFGARSEDYETYFKEVDAWFAEKLIEVKWPSETKTDDREVYQNDSLGFSFKIGKTWKALPAADIESAIKNSNIFFDFVSSADIKEGRVILLTPGDPIKMRQNFWAAPTLLIAVHDQSPFINEKFRRSRETQISSEVGTYMRRTGNIVVQIDEIKGVKVCRVAVSGESHPVKEENADGKKEIVRDKEGIRQVLYYMPMGDKGVTMMFSFPDSAGYSREEIDDFTADVCKDLDGLKVKKDDSDVSYYLIAIALVLAGAIVVVVLVVRSRIKRMQRRLGKRTYKHTGFKPKEPTLAPKKPAPGPKKPPQG